jgi:thiol-disulfide isomerase/thioredoxin
MVLAPPQPAPPPPDNAPPAQAEDPEAAPAGLAAAPELPGRGMPVPNLLALTLEHIRPDSTIDDLKLGDGLIQHRRVTVLNAWATWCQPCKTELPELKALFDAEPWGDRVRFIPVLSQDHVDPDTAHETFAAQLPRGAPFLAELDASGALAQALRADIAAQTQKKRPSPARELAAAIAPLTSLPITVVLDCRRELRLAHVGGLQPADIAELRRRIDLLTAELDTSHCARPVVKPPSADLTKEPDPTPPPPEATDAVAEPPTPKCGDGRCDRRETCESCPADCGCKGKDTCQQRPDSTFHCIRGASTLK